MATTRLNFARVCVEVGIEFEFPNSFDLVLGDGSTYEIFVEYPWKPQVCNSCKSFGHTSSHCPMEVKKVWVPKIAVPPVIPVTHKDSIVDKIDPVIMLSNAIGHKEVSGEKLGVSSVGESSPNPSCFPETDSSPEYNFKHCNLKIDELVKKPVGFNKNWLEGIYSY